MRKAQTFLALEHNQMLYDRVKFWVDSAACAKQTGILLVVCGPNGQIAPVEDFSLADDRGQTLLAGLYSKWTSRSVDYGTLTKLNLLINGSGALVLAFLFWVMGLRILALATLAVAIAKVIPGPIPGPDSPAGYIGMTCFGVAPALAWAGYWTGRLRSPWIVVIFSAVCAAIASLLRQPIGYQGLVLYALVFGFLFMWPNRNKRRAAWWGLGLGVAMAALAIFGSSSLLQLRQLVWDVPVSAQTPSHGISQSLFHGLGTEPNPWGIEWSDAYGLVMMQKLHPDKPYLSNDYLEVLRNTYWDIVLNEPFAVMRIYLQKLWHLNDLPLRWLGMNFFFVASACLVVIAVLFRRNKGAAREPLLFGLILALACGVMVLQGVLAVPWFKHLYPIKVFAILMSFSLLEFVMRKPPPTLKSWIGNDFKSL